MLIPTGDDEFRELGVRHRTLVRDDVAIIPDLLEIERLVNDVVNAPVAA